MQFRRLAEVAVAPFFLPIAIAILFIGLGDAVAGSYLTLFAVNQAHLSPLALGIFLTVLALSGIIISTAFGYWLDRTPSLVPLFLALLMTVVGYALLGLIFSVCAFLEVLVMLAFVLRPSISGARRWLSAGFVAFVLYFLVITWAPSVAILLLAQVLRAIGIGFVGYHGISYIQVLMPNKVGLAATLFSNTTNAGFLVAGLAAVGWAQYLGTDRCFWRARR